MARHPEVHALTTKRLQRDQARKVRGGRSKWFGDHSPNSTAGAATSVWSGCPNANTTGAGNNATLTQHCAQVLHVW